MSEELVLKGTVCAHTDMVAAITTPVFTSPIEPTATISDLPANLIEEILSWVPLKYMRAVRLTCKEWDTLSKSQSFSKMHINKKRSGESMTMAMVDYNLYLMNVVNEEPFIECQGRLTSLDKQIKISKVIHCDGLLLCVSEDEDDVRKVIVGNPYLGQTRSIECRYPLLQENEWVRFSYAVGYEDKGSSTRSYKFLRFIDRWSMSCSWKTLDVTRPHWRIKCCQLGVSLKGNAYFPTASQSNKEEDNYIICFDFTRESFGLLMRLPFDASDEDYVTLSCVREEKLAVMLTRNDYEASPLEFEIWVSTKIEAEKVLWSKFLRVETEAGFYAMVNCESFLIDEEKKVAMGYYKTFSIVGEDGYLKELEFVKRSGRFSNYSRPIVCSYVPSLVQIKQPAPGGGSKTCRDLPLLKIVAVCDTLQKVEGNKTR